jgi:outer membrane protein assembly complex protein YaeT
MRPAARCALGLALALAACRSSGAQEERVPFELALAFEGAATQSEERLAEVARAELARLEVAAPDRAAIDDAAFALELFYRSRGHADVVVDYEFEPGDGDGLAPRARFSIREGPVVRVRALTVEGAVEFSPELVRAHLEPAASGGIYDAERLEKGLEALRERYRRNGFLRAEVPPLETVFDAERTAVSLVLHLREGPAFRIRSLAITGGAATLARREAQLARQYTGAKFLRAVVPQLESALLEAYRVAGHPDARLTTEAELDEASGDVALAVAVTPGAFARIAHVRIEGNQRTRDAAILGIAGIELGRPYDAERLRAAFRELYGTGLFESVALELEGEGEERTLLVRVVEARSVQIRLEPGWGSYEGPRILVGIEENNFQGRGQVLSLEGTASPRAQGMRLAWVDRDFLGSRFTSETTAFAEQREEPSFEFVRRGLGFFLRRDWDEDWSSSSGYEYRPTDVTDDPTQVLPPDVDEDTNVAALSVALVFDDRDNPLVPTRGKRALARLEWADDAFASDTEFLRAQLELAGLLPFGDDNVLSAALRTGLIAPFGASSEVPLPERFFNGGENSVRSFGEDELLPPGRDGEPLGGEAATTLNLELRRPLAGNLAAALFVDAGNVTEDWHDYTDFAGFRSGLGLGLRYVLPIGPVRLDLGLNPNPESDEDELVWHFSVGFPF